MIAEMRPFTISTAAAATYFICPRFKTFLCFLIFSSTFFTDAGDDGKTDEARTRKQLDCVLVSFVKGWSASYKRQSILSCPCWLQLILAPSIDGRWNNDELG